MKPFINNLRKRCPVWKPLKLRIGRGLRLMNRRLFLVNEQLMEIETLKMSYACIFEAINLLLNANSM